ncbi:hypothetical protein [Natrinema salinisoli]|uniref:hypothetical protein n=1 Tax=Natrinema salinisoli TaxID=2878535 RepID=UPI001CF0C7DC|nr:hypothetical protein [Natrinema salinisoli]
MISDWPLIIAGIVVSILLIPLFVSWQLVINPTGIADLPFLVIGFIAMLPGVLMGGIGLWMAARG